MHNTFTATNKADILTQLKTLTASTGWTIKKDTGTELILQNVGLSGTQTVIVGFRLTANGLQLMTATGFVDGIAFDAQPGSNASVFTPVWDSAMTCWLVHDASAITLVAKVSTVFEIASVGLLTTLVPTASYPAPLFIGGTAQYDSIPYTLTDDSHFAFAIEPPYQNNVSKIRDNTGTFEPIQVFEPNLDNGYPAVVLRENVDGSEQLLPQVYNGILCHPHVFSVVGNGISAESIITAGSVNFLVVQNTFRAGSLFAIKLA